MSSSEVCFQLKGSNITSIVLELKQYPSTEFLSQLQDKVSQAPQLFADSAVVISLEKFSPEHTHVDFKPLIADCFEAGLHPMAFRSVDEALLESVKTTGLPALPGAARSASVHAVEADNTPAAELLPNGDGEQVEMTLESPREEEAVEEAVTTIIETRVEIQEKLVHRPAKIIERPVRGGQQIYAEGCDLIVLAQVSEGAEVLADGNIHIYAPLRGRALAGVKGDSNARIFCQQLEAELVSVAGIFILSDELKDKAWKQAAHIQLKDERLTIAQINDK
ncbi:septum site-determining protein MinC [Pseudoteredinibacter isoporae]|uniref:Probable septum site-determining protein MinC n=1 Tax=Pseudoteredinibacter isoporae TaxID=570281 RepID=A0A7X0JWU2_9GAMM|nr:septum site-determining protein MinC [Pseudoteredinibacter isoporae]MBB6522881.1 septum site-determining protein MinC [Pseudoteredinibacter isoporae]NHO88407.1 septum site-determining protein MinC [Pseudoteredinibacter isoporae]NIB23262.1 septum site-determining protein MinC [Pseudoteredinibacter isoporae]